MSKVSLKDSKGQIVVEYVLLLIISVAIATLLVTTMISRDQQNLGFVIQKWSAIISAIGQDTADDL